MAAGLSGNGPCANTSTATRAQRKTPCSEQWPAQETCGYWMGKSDLGFHTTNHHYRTALFLMKRKIFSNCCVFPYFVRYYSYLEMALTGNKIKLQDFSTVLRQVARNPGGRILAWNFFRQHWNHIFQWYLKFAYTPRLMLATNVGQKRR